MFIKAEVTNAPILNSKNQKHGSCSVQLGRQTHNTSKSRPTYFSRQYVSAELPGTQSSWHFSIELLHSLLYQQHSMQSTWVGHQLLHLGILQLLSQRYKLM